MVSQEDERTQQIRAQLKQFAEVNDVTDVHKDVTSLHLNVHTHHPVHVCIPSVDSLLVCCSPWNRPMAWARTLMVRTSFDDGCSTLRNYARR